MCDCVIGCFMPLVNRGYVPDWVIRAVCRSLLRGRLSEERHGGDVVAMQEGMRAFIAGLRASPIAVNTADANEQHYEVPTEYFDLVLGARKKYSACLYPTRKTTLEEAEDAAFAEVCERAELADGMEVVDLGCGWGSLTLYLLERFPTMRVTSVSNSATQKVHIETEATRLGWADRLTVHTMDANVLVLPADTFDRCLSIEMFEHMKNYPELMRRIALFLKPGGKLFVHIFTHHTVAYHFVDEGPSDWMTRHFFSGGTMPSHHLLLNFQDDLAIEDHWKNNGRHYSRTLEDWLKRQDKKEKQVRKVFAATYGDKEVTKWIVRWRMFYMLCSELFRFNKGNEWGVSHYRFVKRGPSEPPAAAPAEAPQRRESAI